MSSSYFDWSFPPEQIWHGFIALAVVFLAIGPVLQDWRAARRRPVTLAELAKHSQPDDLWMAVSGTVYNVTNYLNEHPGGKAQLMKGGGKDATQLFFEAHPQVGIMSGDRKGSFIQAVGYLV